MEIRFSFSVLDIKKPNQTSPKLVGWNRFRFGFGLNFFEKKII
jgi:hypothetical protein